MKTIRRLGALFLFAAACALSWAQENEYPPVTLEKLSGSIYQVKGGRGSNGGVIVGETGIMVIDSKMDEESVRQTIEAIKGISGKPIKYLVNTHSDGDHIMGNRYYPGTVTFIAHENCRDDFFKENSGSVSDWGDPGFYPYTPSLTFDKSMDVWMGTTAIELHYFGIGHTTGDIIVYCPQERVAFIGDLYFTGRPQLIHSHKSGNSFEYVRTMTKMLESLDADTFLSGHADPAGREEIENHILAMIDRQQKVRTLVDQDKSLEEVLEEFNEDEARLVGSIYGEIAGK